METSLYPPHHHHHHQQQPHHHHHHHQQPHQLPSPTSHSSSSSSSNGQTPLAQPRSDPTANNPYPTTFVQADTASFKQVVQMLTGSPRPKPPTSQPDPPAPARPVSHHHNIPPIKSIPNKKTSAQPNSSSSSGFKLYERRNSLKNLKINPIFAPSGPGSGFSPRNEILSPSILDFPSLALSPVTPLIPDPFDRSSVNPTLLGPTASEEERAIKEKGFYFHPSPATTPRESSGGEPPRLLPLFPVTSPRVSSGSANIPPPPSS